MMPTIMKKEELQDGDTFICPTGEYGNFEVGEVYTCDVCGKPVGINIVGVRGDWRSVFAYAAQCGIPKRVAYLKAGDAPIDEGGYCEKLEMATCGDCYEWDEED